MYIFNRAHKTLRSNVCQRLTQQLQCAMSLSRSEPTWLTQTQLTLVTWSKEQQEHETQLMLFADEYA